MSVEINAEKFNIAEKNVGISPCSVAVYPKDELEKISKIIKQSDLEAVKRKAFDNVEDLFSDMGMDITNV